MCYFMLLLLLHLVLMCCIYEQSTARDSGWSEFSIRTIEPSIRIKLAAAACLNMTDNVCVAYCRGNFLVMADDKLFVCMKTHVTKDPSEQTAPCHGTIATTRTQRPCIQLLVSLLMNHQLGKLHNTITKGLKRIILQ